MVDTRERLARMVIWAAATTTLFITPLFSTDPVNVPRFLSLIVFGFIGSLMLLGLKNQILATEYRKVVVVAFMFVIWALISIFLSKVNLIEGFFGVSGRQTGFLTYFSFITLMLCAVFASAQKLQRELPGVLVCVGLISGLYGVFQVFGSDPFDWISSYNPVFSFFGNPNFHSSFMGITAVAAIALTFDSSIKLKRLIGLVAFVLLALFNIYKTESIQGFFVFVTGVSVVGYLMLHNNPKLSRFKIAYLVLTFLAFLGMFIDILQKSPWKPIFYKESVSFRGDFWRAGWKMTVEHPIFGVGLDGYRDHYRLSRDLVAATRAESNVAVDSAHNTFLDISSSGGFPLLTIYLVLIGITVLSIIKVIRRGERFNVSFIAIVGAWFAFLAQSLISINQIGLSIWGWLFMGAIIGYEINGRQKKSSKGLYSLYPIVAVGMGLILGTIVALPLLATDAIFRSSVKSGDVLKIESSIERWPQSVTRIVLVARLLRENNLPDRSIVIARKAVEFNSSNFEAWQELSMQPKATESERVQALKKMKQLDPFNPNLK
jgi:O-antigen ligase